MEFKDFKDKYFGKNIDEIKEGIKEENNFWKNDKEMVDVCLDIDKIIYQILQIDRLHLSIYVLQKKLIILKYIYENFTTLESLPEINTFEDYDVLVEDVIYELSANARFVKELVEEGLKETHIVVLEDLFKIFNTATPSAEELEKLGAQIEGLFKDESPEKLKIIESILEYNDPALKELKSQIYTMTEKKDLEKETILKSIEKETK